MAKVCVEPTRASCALRLFACGNLLSRAKLCVQFEVLLAGDPAGQARQRISAC